MAADTMPMMMSDAGGVKSASFPTAMETAEETTVSDAGGNKSIKGQTTTMICVVVGDDKVGGEGKCHRHFAKENVVFAYYSKRSASCCCGGASRSTGRGECGGGFGIKEGGGRCSPSRGGVERRELGAQLVSIYSA